jgi:capsular polysaccharide export protein
MIRRGFSAFKGERVLLLQGPLGPFFRRLSEDLTLAGAQVFKVNFNGGDWVFYPSSSFNYRGRMEDWPAYLEALLDQLQVDVVMLFGDCRPIHAPVHEIAHRYGLKIGVFEEGYVRPDYITLEQIGVNGHSVIPRNPVFYLNHPVASTSPMMPVGNTFWYAVRWGMLYYFAAGLLKLFFMHYQHHRPLNWLEAFPWLRSVWRKQYYAFKERGILARLTGELNGQFFMAPLQVHNDSQVHTHSDFDSIRHFIQQVMTSFAQHAPPHTTLIIKHHPLDRAYHDYNRSIRKWIKEIGLQGRCLYIHDQHLPTLLQAACGVVVINSTVGLSAISHGTPVKVCGKAVYDIKGLTFQGPLDEFWQQSQHGKPDISLFRNFQYYLVSHTQLNGSFYKRLPIMASSTGLSWTLQNDTEDVSVVDVTSVKQVWEEVSRT